MSFPKSMDDLLNANDVHRVTKMVIETAILAHDDVQSFAAEMTGFTEGLEMARQDRELAERVLYDYYRYMPERIVSETKLIIKALITGEIPPDA